MSLVLIHASTGGVGGAEKSVLEQARAWRRDGSQVRFVLPRPGELSRLLAAESFSSEELAWPGWIDRLAQQQLWWQWTGVFLLPFLLPGLWRYHRRLTVCATGVDRFVSVGVKSHCLSLLAAGALHGRLEWSVRDFIEPRAFRLLLALICRLRGISVLANSRAVARDFARSRVEYPVVRLSRPVRPARRTDGVLTIAHVAHFAPYKGQHLFLGLARRILDAGVRAEFMMAGEVMYPARRYQVYRDDIFALRQKLGLEAAVQMLGAVEDVQGLLERTHVLLHCTRDPEPFGRVVLEGLLCGCEVLCRRGSGVCEVTEEGAVPAALAGVDFGGEYCWVGRS